MAGAALQMDLSGIERLRRRLAALGAPLDRIRMLDILGATVESQVRRRVGDEKADPQGVRWPSWSARHAKTRHAGHSLLEGAGDLLDSIGYVVGIDEVQVGSNLIYFATHQFGDRRRNIPQRAMLGLSSANEAEIEEVIADWIDEVLS